MTDIPEDEEEIVTVDDVIALLNKLLELDRPAIAALLANRVPCNESLANHPTVQVAAQHGGYHVGMFGVLNGLFKTFGNEWGEWGKMRCVFDEDGFLVRFERTPPDCIPFPDKALPRRS